MRYKYQSDIIKRCPFPVGVVTEPPKVPIQAPAGIPNSLKDVKDILRGAVYDALKAKELGYSS